VIALLIFLVAGAPPFSEDMIRADVVRCLPPTVQNTAFIRAHGPLPPGVILDLHIRARRTYVPWQGKFLSPWVRTAPHSLARLYYLGPKSCEGLKKGRSLTASFAVVECLPNDDGAPPSEPPFDCNHVIEKPSAAPSP
jgi:hypothetical protein